MRPKIYCAIVEVSEEILQGYESEPERRRYLKGLAHDRPESGSLVAYRPVEPGAWVRIPTPALNASWDVKDGLSFRFVQAFYCFNQCVLGDL